MSVAFNKFKTTNKNSASEHVTRRVSWFDLTKKGTPSSLTNVKLRRPTSRVFIGKGWVSRRVVSACDLVNASYLPTTKKNYDLEIR